MKPGEIVIKSDSVLRAALERQYSPLLIQILCDAAKDFGLVITSLYRENDDGVHGHMRGADIRTWCYSKGTAKKLLDSINEQWSYDHTRPSKKCAMIHKVVNGAIHMHLQVHPNTMRRRL